MELIATADDVGKMQSTTCFLLQCPKTGVVYRMLSKVVLGKGTFYIIYQNIPRKYMVDPSYSSLAEEKRYYFSVERLKEMITNKSFVIER